jgi:hypothetical protein
MRAGKKRGDRTMKPVSSLAVALAGLALTSLSTPGQAAPMSGISGDLKIAAGDSTLAEQVRHRCYWHRGGLRCPRHRYYRYHRPGFYFHFGPRRHYRRYHRHNRHYGRPWRHWRN